MCGTKAQSECIINVYNERVVRDFRVIFAEISLTEEFSKFMLRTRVGFRTYWVISLPYHCVISIALR